MRKIPHNIDQFKDYTVSEMLKYIRETEHKYAYLYDIFSYKFDMKYDTATKRRELYNKLSLASLSQFADTYQFVDNKLHEELEEVWISKSLEQYTDVIQATEKVLLTNNEAKYWTLDNLEDLHLLGKMNDNEYKLCTRMTQILQTILASNMMHIKFNSFEECDVFVNFLDYAKRETKDVHIPRLLKLPDSHVMKLINKYNSLHDKLMGLA